MRDAALLGGMALLAAGFLAVPAWLAVVGGGRWRRGTAGGRRAVAAAAFLVPWAACLTALAGLAVLDELRNRGLMTWRRPFSAIRFVEALLPYAAALFTVGLTLVALAARAALVSASRRLAERTDGSAAGPAALFDEPGGGADG